ncbi:hypothetical protein Leryth_006199 [Lithospermum erythrorhizon]|nr:hypothetical protein Leryth_006199 [Lithospermum erythrorhizon]
MEHEDIGSTPATLRKSLRRSSLWWIGVQASTSEFLQGFPPQELGRMFQRRTTSTEEGALLLLSCLISPPALPSSKVAAEFIGTLVLMFASEATAIVNQKTQGSETLIGCAASTGLAVMIIILSTGHISGAHLNPGITIAFAALKHFPWKQVIFHPEMDGGVTVPSVGYGEAFALEFIISFILMFVVTAVATDTRAVGELAGIAVGGTVMVTSFIAG